MAAVAAPATPMSPATPWARAGWALASLATALLILVATMIPFFSPLWIDGEQDRAGSAALTGYSPSDVRAATDSIVHDLLFGGDFDVVVGDSRVLDQAEASHMRDVRGVFAGLAILGIASFAGLALLARRLGGQASGATRAAAWAAVGRGAAWLATLLVVLGVVAVVAFDAAFELFHQLLFPGGNFDFDPRT